VTPSSCQNQKPNALLFGNAIGEEEPVPLYQGLPVIVTGNAHPTLATCVAQHLGVELGELTVGRFPDREVRAKFGQNIRGRDVFIIQPTHSFGPIGSDSILELLITIDAARRASAGRITAVTPFFGYARQDRKDEPRVPITAKLMAGLIETAGADRMLAFDLHSPQVQGFTNLPFDHIYARPVLLDALHSLGIESPTFTATDLGSAKYVRSWARRFGQNDVVLMDKERLDEWHVRIKRVLGDVEGKDIILVDDELETGVTLVAATEAAIERGARSVYAAATHAKLIDGTVGRLQATQLRAIVVSDTLPLPDLPNPFVSVSIAKLLADVIRDIHDESSVTRHFD
jgi:ribose-phosphate pyrophosphokinase